MITEIKIPVVRDTNGVYLRWWMNGWHYWNFTNNLDVVMNTSDVDVMTTKVFSIISRIERATKTKTEYAYQLAIEGIKPENVDGFANLLLAERVEQYENGWYNVKITRAEHPLRDGNAPGYSMEFEITRNELPNTPAVFQQTQFLWIGDTLADLDDDEVIAITKQVNNIAELQDRQTDFTASFKVRKTRAMRALFELSGEVGATTSFPYVTQPCRLVQDGIEVISNGRMVLLNSDDQYYHISIYSGNINFFSEAIKVKLKDLTLASTNHTWFSTAIIASHESDLDYCYPLIEPSDDGGLLPLFDSGISVLMDADKIWPHVKLRKIFDEIFSNLGFTVTGSILSNVKFNRLFMPIVNRAGGDVSKYLYSLYNNTKLNHVGGEYLKKEGNVVINGADDHLWSSFCMYQTRFTATYKVRVFIKQLMGVASQAARIAITVDDVDTELELTESQYEGGAIYTRVYVGEVEAQTFKLILFKAVLQFKTAYFDISITAIENPLIGYGTTITPALHLPDMTQSDFIKMICNMFALVPECDSRNRVIDFWDFNEVYENISIARDWSAYLSEKDDGIEFKFGDYARLNYMKFKESDDVIPDNGTGVMQINDATLDESKDIITVPVSYSDEVLVFNQTKNVSRIAMNEYDSKLDIYNPVDKIDPRIVYVSQLTSKTFRIRQPNDPEDIDEISNPKKGSSIEISFGSLGVNYAALANMLYKTNLRHVKFNLPAYEVAQHKHKIPIYLSQYKAYFYVNKINNHVVGKLCVVDLIKL